MIDTYAFGGMVIDGRRYGSDLIVYPDGRVQDGWRRGEGHVLKLADIGDLVAAGPEAARQGARLRRWFRASPEGRDFEEIPALTKHLGRPGTLF